MANLKSPKPSGQYDVGYGRPPMHSRFKPGETATAPAVEKASRPPMKSS